MCVCVWVFMSETQRWTNALELYLRNIENQGDISFLVSKTCENYTLNKMVRNLLKCYLQHNDFIYLILFTQLNGTDRTSYHSDVTILQIIPREKL